QLEAAFPEDAVAFSSGSRDGKHVIVRVWSDRDPGSFYLLDRDAKQTALLTRVKPWLSPDDLAPSTPISIRARDGVELDGYLTRPLGQAESGGGWPMVVLPHGGPFGLRDEWSYDEEVQLLAARGYATLRVNFRGSSGRGRNFVEAGFREWGGRMQADVIDATRWAVEEGHAAPGRICIWGTSYGGYAALMGAALAPDLYRCAVATAAVTDLNVSWRWGDIQRSTWGKNFLEETMGSDSARLREASPVTHAADIRAEVLLVHGRRDARVSYEHAKAMIEAFEKAGKPVEQEVFSNETHGIYGDENRSVYYTRVLGFLDRHIGTGSAPGDGP
ncbi:alpha/beta fold hydrolase, partial [Lysobacter sp. D1-1-M9]|uniref:alpha/beta hydrolase family protein n=1 Tax=Novilysobacter longmucuonensis TaxID=3098603 RepID=UPI002FC87622